MYGILEKDKDERGEWKGQEENTSESDESRQESVAVATSLRIKRRIPVGAVAKGVQCSVSLDLARH